MQTYVPIFIVTIIVSVTLWERAVSRSVIVEDPALISLDEFCKAVRLEFPVDELPVRKFSIYEVNLELLDMINNVGRKFLDTDEKLRGSLLKLSECGPFELPVSIYVWVEPNSVKHTSPAKAPLALERGPTEGMLKEKIDDAASDETRSSAASNACKARDQRTCRFCRFSHADGTSLDAAHIFELETANKISKEDRSDALDLVGLLTVNDIVNLITLCQPCHKFFDKRGGYNLGIDPATHILLVGKTIRSKTTLDGSKYEGLHGSTVEFGGKVHQRPPTELLQHRIKFFEAKQVEEVSKGKGPKMTQKLYYCKYCPFIVYSQDQLDTHSSVCGGTQSSETMLFGKLGEMVISDSI